MKKLTREEVITRINEKHPNRFTFEKFVYKGMHIPATFTCVIHGDSDMQPNNVLRNGGGCYECKVNKLYTAFSNNIDSLQEKSNTLFNNQYDFSECDYKNNVTKIEGVYCKACNKKISITPSNHLRGMHHKGCVSLPLKQPKKAAAVARKRSNEINFLQNWEYANGWNEERLLDGNYAGFIYTFYFPKLDKIYYGSKQLYIKVKNKKKIKPSSKENGWREYTSSSTEVNELINSGEEYIKTIQYAFPLMSETLLVETSLITTLGLHPNCINKAIMNKCSVPKGERAYELYQIIKVLIEALR